MNPLAKRKQQKIYATENANSIKEYKHAYRLNNLKDIKEKSKNYRDSKKDLINAKSAKWRKQNPEKVKEYNRQWIANNVEKIKDNNRKYKINNPDKILEYHANRRAIKKIGESKMTPDDRKICRVFYKMSRRVKKCLGIPHEVDHILPIKKDGPHLPHNLQVMPAKLNRRKGAKVLAQPRYAV